MAIRFRANLRYAAGSGYGAWVGAQMGVRLSMAFHLRKDSPGAERSEVTVEGEHVSMNVFWPDDREGLAQDTVNTLLATVPWLRPDDPGPDPEERSWMDWHRCNHDQEPPVPCPRPEWRWPT